MLRIPFGKSKRVTLPTGTKSAVLPRRTRYLAALLGAGLLATLLVASRLEPDSRGRGTHEQLGLPPCTFALFSGWRCPACGMTTSWALATHGRVWEAFEAHATGTLLAIAALVVGLAATLVALGGRRLSWQPNENVLAGLALIVAVLVLIEWTLRLTAGNA